MRGKERERRGSWTPTIGHVFTVDVKKMEDVKVAMLHDHKMKKYRRGFKIDDERTNKFLPGAMDSVGRIHEEFEDYLRSTVGSKGNDDNFFHKTICELMLGLARDNNRRIVRYEIESKEVRENIRREREISEERARATKESTEAKKAQVREKGEKEKKRSTKGTSNINRVEPESERGESLNR